jgi:HD-GYP domain-containing protein (c-di-GMP phosphodiesterase class II)
MGRYSQLRLFAIFAGAALLLIAVLGGVFAFLALSASRGETEEEAAGLTQRTLTPIIERGGLDDASLEATVAALVSDAVAAIRVWEAGEIVAAAGVSDVSTAPVSEYDTRFYRASSGESEVLVSFAPLGGGRVLEIQQDYAPIEESVAQTTRNLVLLLGASALALLLGLPAILWLAVRGLDREYNRLLYLHRSGQGLRSSLDLPDVLGRLARDAAVFSRAQLAITALVEEDTNDIVVTASYNENDAAVSEHRRKVEEWYMRRCAATGETVRAEADVQPYAAVLGYEPGTGGIAKLLCVAIPGRKEATGVLLLAREPLRGEFTALEVHMVEEVAAQAAMAVEQSLLFSKVRRYAEEVELSYDSTLKVLMAALDTKDPTTSGNSERVTRLTVELAKELGVPKERLIDIERGALLHDVGEIGVPDEVLRKPSSLDHGEWEAVQKHPLLAGLMVSKVGFLEGALPILLYHHERYDGSGYPFGLDGKAIPLEARIFAVVDAYDAMTSDRPYRPAMPHALAMREIRAQAGIHFDPEIVEAFLRVIERARPDLQQAS